MHLLRSPRGLWGYTLIAASRRSTSLCRHNAASSLHLAFAKAFPLSAATSLAKPDWTPRGTESEGRHTERRWPRGWAHTSRGRCALPLEGRRFVHSLRGGDCAGSFGGEGDKGTREACLELSGLTCGACVAKVERALLSVDGVLEASVNFATRQARVVTVLNGDLTPSAAELARTTESTGFPAKVLWDTARENTRVVLDVQGLKCGGCVSKGEAALAAVAGVREASINLATNTATVTLVDSAGGPATSTTPADLVEALSSRGYPSEVLRVSSKWGTGDSGTLNEDDRRVTPAQRHEREAAETERRMRLSLLLLAVSAATHVGHHAHHMLPHGFSLGALDSLPAGWFDWVQAGVATAALAGPGWHLLKSGLAALRRLSPDMNSLVSTGVLTVYFSSVAALLNPSLGLTATFHEPVMLLGAVLLGRSLEARQRFKAARGLQRLFDARPDQVRLVDAEGGVTEVQAASVRVGDTVEVLPSDRFSVDGVILTGRTAADESSLTGEPAPVPKGPGDSVRAGTSSAGDGGAVRVRATATGAQSVLGSVIALVEDAQARKAPVQRLADTIAGKFTWLVFAASASTLLFWGALSPSVLGAASASAPAALAGVLGGGQGGGAWALGVRLAVDVCLVACPCSLGLATPTAIMVGTGVAAERGILLKGADVLETARKATAVVFDKTGTLTTGKSTITGVISLDEEWLADRVLEVASAVERGCRHPLAEAVVSAAEKGLPEKTPLDASGLRTVPGMGASAQVKLRGSDSKTTEVHVGSPRYIREVVPSGAAHANPIVQRLLFAEGAEEFDSHEESGALSNEVAQRLSEGQTAIVVAAEGKPVGLLFSSDTVRPAAAAAVASLVQRGLTVRVASGDRREAVWTAAAAAGVPREDTTWAATPADKASLVRSMQAQGDIVMVVGDGVNDAPALAAADVGVAMRGGTGSAMDAADIVLMRDDVRAAGMAVDISKLTMRKVRTNLMWALGYNAVAIPVAAGAFLPGWGLMLFPALAGAIMSCSSVAVVTNSLLLRRALKRELAPLDVGGKRQE